MRQQPATDWRCSAVGASQAAGWEWLAARSWSRLSELPSADEREGPWRRPLSQTTRHFELRRSQSGEGSPIIFAKGFLTEGAHENADWLHLLRERFPTNPIYRLHWGSKELRSLGGLTINKTGSVALSKAIKKAGAQATKRGIKRLSIFGAVAGGADVLANPWIVADHRATLTGIALAEVLARVDGVSFILAGHSLGAKVCVEAASALGARRAAEPVIEEIHLLGAAVATGQDWQLLCNGLEGTIWNNWSRN